MHTQTPPPQNSITRIDSKSTVDTVMTPLAKQLMTQDGNMFFPGTHSLKVTIPVQEDTRVRAVAARHPPRVPHLHSLHTRNSSAVTRDTPPQVRQLMLGFSSEGTASGQDLAAWRQSFVSAFSNPEPETSVSLGSSDRFGSSDRAIESVAELVVVSAGCSRVRVVCVGK